MTKLGDKCPGCGEEAYESSHACSSCGFAEEAYEKVDSFEFMLKHVSKDSVWHEYYVKHDATNIGYVTEFLTIGDQVPQRNAYKMGGAPLKDGDTYLNFNTRYEAARALLHQRQEELF